MRAPQATAIAERLVRTVRAECLDWLLILNRRHLERVLRVYVEHYNTQRPHRALALRPRSLGSHRRQPPPARSSAMTASAASSMSTTETPPEVRHDYWRPSRFPQKRASAVAVQQRAELGGGCCRVKP
jgi:transposase InsO family protein